MEVVQKENSVVATEDNQLGFAEIATQLWQFKWVVFAILVLTAVISAWFALQMPNIYRTSAVLAPATEKKAGLGGLGSQLGGLASLAGVNLSASGAVDRTDLAIELLKSKDFLANFIRENNLLVPIMAAKSWDLTHDTLVLDSEVYNEANKTWIRESVLPRLPQPSFVEAAEKLSELIEITKDKTTGMVKVSLEYYSPILARNWAQSLISAVNNEIRQRDIKESESSIAYLNQQLDKTQINELRAALVQLIEDQTKTLMLANIRADYALKTIDPPFLPEEKFKPRRSIVVLFSIFGVMLFLSLIAYLRCLKQKNDQGRE